MNSFEYLHASSLEEASGQLAGAGGNDVSPPGAAQEVLAKAAGIDLLDLIKEALVRPSRLVHLRRVPGLDLIEESAGELHLGALVTLHELATNETVRRLFGGLARAAALAATPQVRNVATLGGNLCQRNRCWYFRNADFPCLRKGGELCFAEEGENRYHGILGESFCHAVHPSSLAPMLIALDARATVHGVEGERTARLGGEFFQVAPLEARDVSIEPGEIITEVVIPAGVRGLRTAYREVRERRSFDWALSSVSVALRMEGKTCREARVVLGSVAPVPWRSTEAEKSLAGRPITLESVSRAAEAALAAARPMSQNAYKVEITRTLIERAVLAAADESAGLQGFSSGSSDDGAK